MGIDRPLFTYSDQALEDLLLEKAYECGGAFGYGDEVKGRQAAYEFLAIFEELMSRPSYTGPTNEATNEFVRMTVEQVRDYLDAME